MHRQMKKTAPQAWIVDADKEKRVMKKWISILVLATAITAGAAIQPLMIGQPIPAGSLQTVDGTSFDLLEAATEQPLAIIFYRGGWCPYCNKHLGQLQEIDPELRKLGYRIIAISTDRPQKVAESLEKGKMTYTLLSDSSMQTAKAFGIAFEVEAPMLEKLASYNIDIEDASGEKHHLLPVPSVFLVGTDGIIDFTYVNPDYKTRLAPEVILAAVKAAQ